MAPLVSCWLALSLLLPCSHSVAPSLPLETRFSFLAFCTCCPVQSSPVLTHSPFIHRSIHPSTSTKRLNEFNQLINHPIHSINQSIKLNHRHHHPRKSFDHYTFDAKLYRIEFESSFASLNTSRSESASLSPLICRPFSHSIPDRTKPPRITTLTSTPDNSPPLGHALAGVSGLKPWPPSPSRHGSQRQQGLSHLASFFDPTLAFIEIIRWQCWY